MPMICTPCGQKIVEEQAVVYAIVKNGQLYFETTCFHHPVDDAVLILGSTTCIEKWLAEHPEHTEAIKRAFLRRQSFHSKEGGVS